MRLVGIIKEVSPDPKEDKFGVIEFQTKYFKNFPVYMDSSLGFYTALGKKSLLKQSLPTWNPFKLYGGVKSMNARLSSKGIEGNLQGEGLVQGGIFLVSQSGEVTYVYNEKTGYELPIAEIQTAIEALILPTKEAADNVEAAAAPSAEAVPAKVETGKDCGCGN